MNGGSQFDKPSDEEFKNHFEKLLRVEECRPLQIPLHCPYISITDDRYSSIEIDVSK